MKNSFKYLIITALFLVALFFANAGNIFVKNGEFNTSGDLYIGGDSLFVNHTIKKVGIANVKPEQSLDTWGNIIMGGTGRLLQHDDSDTYIHYFNFDRIRFIAGGEWLMDLYEGSQDYVKLGDGGNVDINLNDGMFVRGSNKNVGIGTTDPASNLNVVGEVNITGISNDGTGKIVCIEANGQLGTCSNDPSSGSGTCTCL